MSKRNAILTAATGLFSRNGFQGTAMAELSAITGAATGTIFHHFKNKEDLFLQVLQNVKDRIIGQFEQHQQRCPATNGLEMVENAVTFYLHLAGEMEDQFLILHRHDPYQLAETSPVCRSHLEAIYTCLLDIFEVRIRIGLEDGSVTVEAPRKTAMILFAMVDGIVRFNTYNVYDAGALADSLIAGCRRLLTEKR